MVDKILLLLVLAILGSSMSLSQYQTLELKNPRVILSDSDIDSSVNYPDLNKLVFVTPWNKKGQQYTLKYGQKINYVSPCWYELQIDKRNNALFQNQNNYDQTFAQTLKSTHPHIKLIPRVYLPGDRHTFFTAVSNNKSKFKATIKLISKIIADKHFDGIIWDTPYNFFQPSRQPLNKFIVEFVNAIKAAIPPQKLVFLNLANPIDHMHSLDVQTFRKFNVDAILIQNYDKGYRFLEMVDRSIAWHKQLKVKAKLILLLPFFSIQQSNYKSIATPDAVSSINEKGVSSARQVSGMCLIGEQQTNVKYYIPCYGYFKKAFEKAKKAGAEVGFWQGGNGLQNYYKFL